MSDGVTISQAAAFAGITVKAARHYHRLGLVAEPSRDLSGYRRYRSTDLLRLMQVRTLAGAGVPLVEIPHLLDAEPKQFAATVKDVERQLTERIDELVARRATLYRLAQGDRLLLPDRACALLDRFAKVGFSRDFVAAQREGLVLFRALIPEGFDHFMEQIEHRLRDAEFVKLMKRSWEAMAWAPSDPRIGKLASALANKLLDHRDWLVLPTGFLSRPDATTRYGLVNRHREEESPAIARLKVLVEARLRAAGIDVP